MNRIFTPSQTVGPFFSIGLTWPEGQYVVPEGSPGALWIRGRVLDGAGDPVPDAVIETWQADERGVFPASNAPTGGGRAFRGFARCATSADGGFGVYTVKPGRVRDSSAVQAPHIAVAVFARGLIEHLVTRIYFADEDNDSDPLWRALGGEPRRSTLLAAVESGGYRFDVRLQGEHETVFFAL